MVGKIQSIVDRQVLDWIHRVIRGFVVKTDKLNSMVLILRSIGVGGNVVGEKVAKSLGCPFYDKEFVKMIVERIGWDLVIVESVDERTMDGIQRFLMSFWNRDYL